MLLSRLNKSKFSIAFAFDLLKKNTPPLFKFPASEPSILIAHAYSTIKMTCIERLISMPTSHSPHRCGVRADYHPPPFIFLSISAVRYRSGQRNKSRNPLFPIKMTQRHTTGNPFICREILCRFIIIRDIWCSYSRNFVKFGMSYLRIAILKLPLIILKK